MNSTQSDQTAEEVPKSDNPHVEAQAAVRSLRTLLEGDEREQHETFEYLKQVLDEDRPSNRSLFQ